MSKTSTDSLTFLSRLDAKDAYPNTKFDALIHAGVLFRPGQVTEESFVPFISVWHDDTHSKAEKELGAALQRGEKTKQNLMIDASVLRRIRPDDPTEDEITISLIPPPGSDGVDPVKLAESLVDLHRRIAAMSPRFNLQDAHRYADFDINAEIDSDPDRNLCRTAWLTLAQSIHLACRALNTAVGSKCDELKEAYQRVREEREEGTEILDAQEPWNQAYRYLSIAESDMLPQPTAAPQMQL